MIYGFGHKKQTGKNTAVKIWQALDIWHNELIDAHILNEHEHDTAFVKYVLTNQHLTEYSDFEQKSFAYKIKQIVCILIGCTMEQLEDPVFKETPLPKSWWKWRLQITDLNGNLRFDYIDYNNTTEEYELYNLGAGEQLNSFGLEKLTPRGLLQLLGTECGREILHPNIWVNSLFSEYDKTANWLISDVRFPNEAERIKSRGGKLIKVTRRLGGYISDLPEGSPLQHLERGLEIHESEKALTDYEDWDYVIENVGTIDDLIVRIKEIMIREKVIKL